MSNGVIEAKSAGSQPSGFVHPLSIKYLEQAGYKTDDLKSQSWNDFEDFTPDVVITVCDSAAGEPCPVYFGKSLKVHWGLDDPSKVLGSDKEKEEAFFTCINEIKERVEELKILAEANLSKSALSRQLAARETRQ
jgi:arsenate reductase